MNALRGVVIFTLIEVVTMVLWLYFASRGSLLGIILLAAGLGVEHYVAINVGAGRAPFGPLPPNKVI